MNDNGWTFKNETEVNSWIDVCNKYISAHEALKSYYAKKSSIFGIAMIIISCIVTILGAISSSNDIKALVIILTVISGISAGLGTYLEKDSPNQKMMKHNEASLKYKQIIVDITYQLALNKKNRQECPEFMRLIMETMNKLEDGEDGISIIPKEIVSVLSKEYEKGKQITVVIDKDIAVSEEKKETEDRKPQHVSKDSISETVDDELATPIVPSEGTKKLSYETSKKFEIFYKNSDVAKYIEGKKQYQIDRLNRSV